MGYTGWRKYLTDHRIWVACGIAIIAIFVWGAINVTSPTVQLTALSVDADGKIAPDTAFLLESSGETDIDALREAIRVEPKIAFELSESEPGSYLLTPLNYLDANSVISFTVYDTVFSFAVQNKLYVLSTFPSNGSMLVPVDTGIEFIFNSQNISLESIESAFAISPEVKGYFGYGNRRFVFYPEERFSYGSNYTVTLSPELTSEDGASLGEEARVSFTTISEEEQNLKSMFQISGNGFSVNSLSDETPLVQAYIDKSAARDDQTVAVTLHAFDGWEDYLAALQNSASINPNNRYSAAASIDTSGLREYASFDITPIKAQTNEDYDRGAWILQFPEALPEGWYAASFTLDINGGKATRQLFMQVSDLSVFYMLNGSDMLAWINDASTGEPVSGAEIEVTGAYRAKGVTGDDGAVHITNGQPPDMENDYMSTFFTVKAQDRVFVDTDVYYTYYGDQGAEARAYMSYLFTDRPVYHTTDIIHVWGMIRPRTSDVSVPENLTLVLGDDVVTQPITPLPDGTFTAELKIESMAASYWMQLRLKTGDVELQNAYLRIEDFVKPVYTASAAPEQPVYMLENGSRIGIGVDVSTFDGTPVSDFGISLNSWSGGMEVVNGGELSTDSQGHARAELRVTESPDSWYPRSYSYEFSSNEAQDESFYLYGQFYGIHRDVMLRAVPDLKSGGSKVEVSTHSVDISRIQTPEQLWEKDALKGQALSASVKAEIYKVYYDKIKTGTHYDFINRVSVESYRYDRREEVVETREFSTENGAYTLTDLPVSDNDACYFVKLTASDSKGRPVVTTAYLGDIYSRYGSYDNGNHSYMLVKQTDPSNAVVEELWGETRLGYNLSSFEDDENVVYMLMDNDLPVENMQGRLLYGVVQDRFSNIETSGQSAVTLPFSESLLPNYVITGAYFDGKHIFVLENTYMYFDPRQRELDIQLEPDKESYAPADEVTVAVTVTNKYTGKPAADTSVVLSVVDEAVFAIQEQNSNILQRMYESIYYPYIRKYTSYLQLNMGGPGEKGGGGPGSMRTEFEDTACFAVGKTDSNGKTGFTFKLADNITSWRLTSLALSPENHAGNTKTNIAATKDFFILPIVNQTLIEGDSFSVGVYGTGAKVEAGDAVNYRVSIAGNGVNESKQVASTLREYAGAEFGGLKQGNYTVTIEAECGPYWDGVQLPFSVVESGIEVSLVKTFDVKDGVSVDSLRYPVGVSCYSKGGKTYNAVFNSVYEMSTGGRADMRLARRYAALQLKKNGSYWYDSSALEEDYSDLGGNYMLSLLPYSEPDLELSVKARLAMPELVGAQCLRGLTTANSGNYAGARSAVYLAQALAGEPVTANLSEMLESGSDLNYKDKMYLALAMAVSGDTEGAQAWYDRLVKPYIAELTGISGDKALYVDVSDPVISKEDCSAAASLLATALSADEADGLALYLAEKKSKYEPYLFEQIYYLQKSAPSNESPASFSYVRDGKAVTVELGQYPVFVSFNREQLAEAGFTVLSGEVYADVYYTGSPLQTADESKRMIGFTKRVEPVGGSFEVGSLVKVTLTPDFSQLDADIGDTLLVVDDYIPTGMRFERYDYDFYRNSGDIGWYLNSRQGQRLQFTVYGLNYKGVKPLVYYVRCATDGEYVVESAYITSASGDTWGATVRGTVKIQ